MNHTRFIYLEITFICIVKNTTVQLGFMSLFFNNKLQERIEFKKRFLWTTEMFSSGFNLATLEGESCACLLIC
jgi:hypothetical protein